MASMYEYPRPALTVDAVVFGLDDEDLKVLLIRRNLAPFQDRWALPGGFVRVEESLEAETQHDIRTITRLGQTILKREWQRVKIGT